MKRGDIWLIGILLIAVTWFMVQYIQSESEANHDDGKRYAQITIDGKVFQTVELTEETQEIEVKSKYGYNLVKVHDKGVEVVEADCPDKLDVDMGFKDRVGETIICLPNRMIVEVIGEQEEDEGGGADAVAI